MPSIQPQTEAFVSMFERASDDDRAKLGEMHLHYEREIHRIRAEGNEPQNIAHTLHMLIDESIARTLQTKNGRKVKCKKGCAACCKLHVSITHEEAYLLLGWCETEGIAIDWPKVERQAAHGLGTWARQDAADRRCAFLGDGDVCRVYEHRPAACRKYMVMSDPMNCDTVKHPGREVTIVAGIEAEAVTSAMLGILSYASMAKMLVSVRDEETNNHD